MIYHTFTLGHLPAHELVPTLVHTFLAAYSSPSTNINNTDSNPAWHFCWLNNNNKPVIGLLPKISWQVLPIQHTQNTHDNSIAPENTSLTIKLINTIRDENNFEKSNQQFTTPTDDKDSKNLPFLCNHHISITTYEEWIETLIDYAKKYEPNTANLNANHIKAGRTLYHHGFMGFIGYDIAAKALSPLCQNIQLTNQPCAFLAHYDVYLSLDENQNWQLNMQQDVPQKIQDMVVQFLSEIDANLLDADNTAGSLSVSVSSKLNNKLPLVLKNNWQFSQYATAFQQTQQYLHQGDSYQINLTQKWQTQFNDIAASNNKNITPQTVNTNYLLVSYLAVLHQNTQAPFAGYLYLDNSTTPTPEHEEATLEKSQAEISESIATEKLTADTLHKNPTTNTNTNRFELLSCSPELFVEFYKDEAGKQKIVTKPIKGTRPRGVTPEQDEQHKQELADSDKDRAENVMIVDLLRNDLGRFAQTGSVEVTKLFDIESFSNVHHMVSTINATIKKESHPLSVLFASLPAGSITGTPKKRSVEIIGELETAPRGAYCGTLGFMNFDGTGQWNVLIRSLQANTSGEVNLWAGGGITVASECEAEYQECHDKVDNLLAILSKP